ncbi:MAG TPA: carbon-nitrogen hydrolase family protein [Solirubrobacteraceae bacterium]|nr:carbon-nitrogen hydrolase family protein [Solirubrobacteraceae bacterium]
MRVALLQLAPGDDGERACREAAGRGADVALFPELWQSGCDLSEPEPAAAEWLESWAALARELRMAIVATHFGAGPSNAATLFDREGRDALTYAKVNTCWFDAEAPLVPGEELRAVDLDLGGGEHVRAGLMICFDREFPEPARALAADGAELILVPNSCPLTDDRVFQFRARAFENKCAAAMANYATDGGRSCAFSGMVCDADGRELDQRLVEAGPERGVYLADVDLAELRAYREREPWGPLQARPQVGR